MRDSDPFAVERLDMYYLQRPTSLARLFRPSVRGYLRLRHSLRGVRLPGNAGTAG